MNFFKNLFGRGGSASGGGARGFGDAPAHLLSVFVQPRGCDEVVHVRINLHNDLSERDEGGYLVNKVVMGTTCFQRVELSLTFDAKRQIVERQISGGTLVDEDAYSAWQAAQQAKS
jgi:hypothetical protein